MDNWLLCSDAEPSFLGIFDFSVAPTLLFYSYIPIAFFSLLLGVFILNSNKSSLKSKLFFGLSLSFFFWILLILFQWTAAHVNLVHFAWQILGIVEVAIFIFALYFYYVFAFEKDLPYSVKILFASIISTVAVLAPTILNVEYFNSAYCESHVGRLWDFIYVFEAASIVVILFLGFLRNKEIKNNSFLRNQLIILTLGISLFLSIFSFTNIFGEITKTYEFNLFGPIGMLSFLGLLVYMMVRFQAFSIKLITTQALIWGLIVLIGSQFFFIQTSINFFLTGITFVAIIIFGHFLINSVKREIEQREKLEELNEELKSLLTQRESLVHLITHKVKASFTRSKYIFAEMVGGGFGELTPELKDMSKKGLDSDNEGIKTVDLVLNAFNLEKGIVKYEMASLDFKAMVLDSAESRRAPAEAKGLKMNLEIEEADFTISGDVFWLKEVTNNLVENAVRYTKEGSITVGLAKKNDKLLFSVKDTGVGITDEDKKNLFTEGGRGKNSVKVNVDSTGYGLFSVKLVVEAHGGRVWADSAGEGTGSTFSVELNLVNK